MKINDAEEIEKEEIKQEQKSPDIEEHSMEVIKKKEEENIETISKEEVVEEVKNTSDTKKMYDEYIVKNGDTLAAICKTRYGSLVLLEEICSINNIKNADYIAPGQKIYLP